MATLIGLAPDPSAERALQRLLDALSPSVISGGVIVDALRNAVLFAGLGVVWISTTSRESFRSALAESATSAFLLSVAIELVQIVSPDRNASIVDVVTDTAGAVAGAVAMLALVRAVRRARARKSWVGLPAWLVAGAYAGAVVAEATGPLFRQRLVELEGFDPILRMRSAVSGEGIIPSSPIVWADLGLDALLFAPAGALGVAALVERGVSARKAAWVVALAGLVAVAGGEALHGIFGVEIVPLAVLVHAIAIGIGAMVAARLLHPPTGAYPSIPLLRLLLASFAALLFLWAARPFVPRLDLASMAAEADPRRLVPMLALAGRKDLFSVTHVIRQCLLFVPVGAYLAVWPLRRRGVFAGLLPALYGATFLELLHLVIAARFFDTTNIVLACAGAGVGWLLVRGARITIQEELYPERRGEVAG